MDKDTLLKIVGYAIASLIVAGGGKLGLNKLETNQSLIRQDVHETRNGYKRKLERIENKLDKCLEGLNED